MSDDQPQREPWDTLEGPVTLTRQVLDHLRIAIAGGTLQPGSITSVPALANLLGVSRTPVREALLQLEKEGRIAFQRGRGIRIEEPTTRDIVDVFQIRLALEPLATRYAVLRNAAALGKQLDSIYRAMVQTANENDGQRFWIHDRAFHSAILGASGNVRLAHYVDDLRDLILLRETTVAALTNRGFADIAYEHEPILRAIEDGDADGAQEAMRRQIRHTAQVMLEHIHATSKPTVVEDDSTSSKATAESEFIRNHTGQQSGQTLFEDSEEWPAPFVHVGDSYRDPFTPDEISAVSDEIRGIPGETRMKSDETRAVADDTATRTDNTIGHCACGCGRTFVRASQGRPRRFATAACREAARLRRAQGLPENSPLSPSRRRRSSMRNLTTAAARLPDDDRVPG